MLIEETANVRRPEEVCAIWVKSDAGISQAGGFDSPEAARLAGLALAAKDPEARKAFFQQFDQLVPDHFRQRKKKLLQNDQRQREESGFFYIQF